jgi:TPP-dependent pyruvate/acetoin dehydrogenase alpha subunit
MGGHATHDEREARRLIPDDVFAYWGKRDPIGMYEEYLKSAGITEDDLRAVEERVTEEVDRASDEALHSRETAKPAPESVLEDVYEDSARRRERRPQG